MSRSLPTRPNLDYLKREAKRLLRNVRAGQRTDIDLVRMLPEHARSGDDEIQSAATLAAAQQALALDYGYPGWSELKAFVTSQTPVIQTPRPAFRVGSFDEAIAHYLDWLGFRLDWEWWETPGEPKVAALSRDHCAFMINEHVDANGPVSLHMDVSNLYVLIFEGKDEAAQKKILATVRSKMGRVVSARLDAGGELPTPEELRDAVGPPLGTAIEVLNEFPEYGELFDERRRSESGESEDPPG